jgi:hypothetical protein
VIIGVACEDDGHFSAVSYLVDAALMARHTRIESDIGRHRSWRGLDPLQPWYRYKASDARDLRPIAIGGVRLTPHGFIKGEALKPEAGMWRNVLLLFCRCEPRPDVVLLVRDMDGRGHRRQSMEQVRDGLQWPFVIALATPQPEIEAWHVSGFVPANASERNALTELCRRLSFDPTLQSHRLTSRPNDASTDAKRVLDALCAGDQDRRRSCIGDPSILHQRGAANGARAFLDEVEHGIVPAFVPAPG